MDNEPVALTDEELDTVAGGGGGMDGSGAPMPSIIYEKFAK